MNVAVAGPYRGALSGEGGVSTLVDPATGRPLTTLPSASLAETDRAIEAAQAAFPAWKAVSPGDRARLLRRFAAVVEEHIGELADLEVQNSGHTIGNATWEAGNVRDVLNYYSAAPERLFGRQIPVAGGIDITFHEPLGVVGIIVPWNFPMPIAGWGFGPALAAGNTVVLKPAEVTPLTAIRLAELALEAGLPEDVFTVIPGKGSVVGNRFVTHPLVRKVCFTGSTVVGKRIMARRRRPGEAGDPGTRREEREHHLRRRRPGDRGGRGARRGLRQCRPGLLRPVPDPGAAQRVRRVPRPAGTGRPRASGCGNRPTPDAEMGPLITAGQRDSVSAYVDGDRRRLHRNGSAGAGLDGGFWYPPTVVLPASPADRIWREEVFGPVVAVLPFDDEADAIAAGQRQRLRPVRLDFHLGRRPGATRRAQASRPATCR